MTNRKGGPKTARGKAISSQNAIKHGALSTKLNSKQDQLAYQNMLDALKDAYPQNHPLIHLQLERIASIKVQLDRIQRIIDGTFAQSREPHEKAEKIAQLLEMTPQEGRELLDQMEKGLPANLMRASPQLDNIIKELALHHWEAFESSQEFLDHTPQLCSYLAYHAQQKNMSISHWVPKIKNTLSISSLEKEIISKLIKVAGTDENIQNQFTQLDKSIIDKMLRETTHGIIKQACQQIIEVHKSLMIQNYRADIFTTLMQINDGSIGLRLDDLDKLYRYQTAIQRQLSTAIGELLELNKLILPNGQ